MNAEKLKSNWPLIPVIVVLVILIVFIWQRGDDGGTTTVSTASGDVELPAGLARAFPDTDLSKNSIDTSLILGGGPGKDGIPAITNPEFIPLSQSDTPDTTRGLFLDMNGEQRFYPYNIMVWHEIVNDNIGGTPVAVTFCPLCGSAIVFNPIVDGQQLEFGVSGYLFESNLLMYDRTTESLWSQSLGEAVVGEFTDTELERLPFQLLEMSTVKEKFPNAVVMSTNTGFSRDYTFYPYGNYDNSDDLFFPVSVEDKRFEGKEIFYIIALGEDKSVALRIGEMENDQEITFDADGETLVAVRRDGGEIEVRGESGEIVPGYFEMWFSWATHHQDTGLVWEPQS